jgi:TIR domain
VAGFVFLSYARGDRAYVDQLAAFLTGQGIGVWHDHEITSGAVWVSAVAEQIRRATAVLAVMSEESARSEWSSARSTMQMTKASHFYRCYSQVPAW